MLAKWWWVYEWVRALVSESAERMDLRLEKQRGWQWGAQKDQEWDLCLGKQWGA